MVSDTKIVTCDISTLKSILLYIICVTNIIKKSSNKYGMVESVE